MANKKSTLKGKMVFSTTQVVLFVLAFAAVGGVAVWKSLAASTSGSLAIIQTSPQRGSPITFTYSVSSKLPSKSVPLISVSCSQGDQAVYLDVAAASSNHQYTLTSPSWTSGSADCIASLYYYTWTGHSETGVVHLADVSFTAAG